MRLGFARDESINEGASGGVDDLCVSLEVVFEEFSQLEWLGRWVERGEWMGWSNVDVGSLNNAKACI